MPCRATQDGQVKAESSDKTWSTGEGNGKLLQYSFFENPMNNMKRQKRYDISTSSNESLKIEFPCLLVGWLELHVLI